MIETSAGIVANDFLTADVFRLELEVPKIAAGVQAGQFVHLGVPGFSLRRPFTVAACSGKTITLILRRQGKGTRALAAVAAGAVLPILGPLGNGFRPGQGAPLLLGGGMGAAALTLLAARLGACTFVVGARRREDLWLDSLALPAGVAVQYCTDDGSKGFAGDLTLWARHYLEAGSWVAACGPEPMLASLQGLLREREIPGQFALEGRMACGLGACMSCVCQTTAGQALVCKDGPVFDGREVVFR